MTRWIFMDLLPTKREEGGWFRWLYFIYIKMYIYRYMISWNIQSAKRTPVCKGKYFPHSFDHNKCNHFPMLMFVCLLFLPSMVFSTIPLLPSPITKYKRRMNKSQMTKYRFSITSFQVQSRRDKPGTDKHWCDLADIMVYKTGLRPYGKQNQRQRERNSSRILRIYEQLNL